MAFGIDPFADIRKQIQHLREQLKNPNKPLLFGKPLMKQIGALTVAASQKAFREQALGDIKWPPRYPNQEAPKFNIAGALMDWKSGRTAPKPNRFQDQPALIDEGMRGGLQGSITFQVTDALSVSVGSGKPYAELQQKGGVTFIHYDKATRKRISEWLYANSGKLRKKAAPYEDKVKPLLRSSTWAQRVASRPFVGVTDELAGDIRTAIALYFRKVQH